MPTHILPTTVVGSYPQLEWPVNRAMLSKVVPRTRLHDMWRLPLPSLGIGVKCPLCLPEPARGGEFW